MMRGQEALEAMRHGGKVPMVVIIEADPWPQLRFAQTWPALTPSVAILQMAPGEYPNAASLRCIVGLSVQVGGQHRGSVYWLRDACIKAGASRVVASVYRHHTLSSGDLQVALIETTDTDGELTWPH